MSYAILTKYHPATATKQARISAQMMHHKRKYYPLDYTKGRGQNHLDVAQAYCAHLNKISPFGEYQGEQSKRYISSFGLIDNMSYAHFVSYT